MIIVNEYFIGFIYKKLNLYGGITEV